MKCIFGCIILLVNLLHPIPSDSGAFWFGQGRLANALATFIDSRTWAHQYGFAERSKSHPFILVCERDNAHFPVLPDASSSESPAFFIIS